jgi:hypothetical protein
VRRGQFAEFLSCLVDLVVSEKHFALRDHALQQLRVRSDGPDWLSEVPVPSVRFATEPGRSTWVGFTFSPETRRLVMRPRQYTEIFRRRSACCTRAALP